MRYMRKLHPYLDILVSSIGEVFVPGDTWHKAHWTFGCKTSKGYRTVKINGKVYSVHRLAAETYLGQIPRGMEVDHLNRVRDDNRVENLRIVTSSENSRNTSSHDRVEARGGTHVYEDARKANRERVARYKQSKRKTHRLVNFSDGSQRWVPLANAILLLAIPLKERNYYAE